MPQCVTCAYPMIHVASGNLKNVWVNEDEKAKETTKKHNITLKEGETPVGCHVCPECGHCTWLET